MEDKEIDIRNKSKEELIEIYSKIAKQVEQCNKVYDEKKDIEEACKIIERIKEKN